MNTYPGIYKALDGTIYYYLNKSNYFSFERGIWEKDEDLEEHKKDINITREYLANTYGEVKSKEHAEFIVKLAEGAGFEVGVYHQVDKWFCFSEDQLFFFTEGLTASDAGEKQITIPLPPKELDLIDSLPEVEPTKIFTGEEIQTKELEVVEGGICEAIKSSSAIHELERKGYKFTNLDWVLPNASEEPKKLSINEIKVKVTNNTDSLVQIKKSEDESSVFIYVNDPPKEPEIKTPLDFGAVSDEKLKPKCWPQVGDEVAWSPKLSRKGTLLNVYEGMAWLKDSYGEFVSIEVNKLKKPPAPEEELAKELVNKLQADQGVKINDEKFCALKVISRAIVNGRIKGLSYKPE